MLTSVRAKDPAFGFSGGCSLLAGMARDPGMSDRVGLMLESTRGSEVFAASAGACSSLAGMASAAGDSDKAAEDGPRPSKPAGAPRDSQACPSAMPFIPALRIVAAALACLSCSCPSCTSSTADTLECIRCNASLCLVCRAATATVANSRFLAAASYISPARSRAATVWDVTADAELAADAGSAPARRAASAGIASSAEASTSITFRLSAWPGSQWVYILQSVYQCGFFLWLQLPVGYTTTLSPGMQLAVECTHPEAQK